DLLGGSDQLQVIGTQGADIVTVTSALVTINPAVGGPFETVNYTNTEDLRVLGLAGNDTFNVTPAATTTIFIDGGDPIGSTPGDRLVLNPPAGAFSIEPGPESDEGGANFAAAARLSWDHIEAVTVNGG